MINIQNTDDNECFKWCLVRCVNPTDHNPRKITKIDKDLTKRFDLKNVTFSVKIRDVHKIEKKKTKKKKKNSIGISVFGYENKENIQSMYQSNFF